MQEQLTGYYAYDYDYERHQNRQKEIAKIHDEMKDVNYLFGRVAEMVDEQVINVDNIQLNVRTAENYIEDGTQQLLGARQQQKNCGNKLCILFVALAVVIIIFIIIISVLFTNKKI